MNKRRLFIMEPSKIGEQHITLIEGYVEAIGRSNSIKQDFELNLLASKKHLLIYRPF